MVLLKGRVVRRSPSRDFQQERLVCVVSFGVVPTLVGSTAPLYGPPLGSQTVPHETVLQRPPPRPSLEVLVGPRSGQVVQEETRLGPPPQSGHEPRRHLARPPPPVGSRPPSVPGRLRPGGRGPTGDVVQGHGQGLAVWTPPEIQRPTVGVEVQTPVGPPGTVSSTQR